MTRNCVVYCVSFILVVLTLLVCLVSCFSIPVDAAEPDSAMFSKVYSDNSLGLVVFCHNETGVMYLWRKGGYAGGLTIMVDADGKPLIYTPEEVQQ